MPTAEGFNQYILLFLLEIALIGGAFYAVWTLAGGGGSSSDSVPLIILDGISLAALGVVLSVFLLSVLEWVTGVGLVFKPGPLSISNFVPSRSAMSFLASTRGDLEKLQYSSRDKDVEAYEHVVNSERARKSRQLAEYEAYQRHLARERHRETEERAKRAAYLDFLREEKRQQLQQQQSGS